MKRLTLCMSVSLCVAACAGPLGPIAGGRLPDTRTAPPPADWSFTRDVMVVQLETRPDKPYSVNVGCIDHARALYVGSPDPQSSAWIANLVADPLVRLRVGETTYDLRATRVTDAAEWALAGRKLFEKYDIEVEPGDDPGWLFRLDPR